MQPSFTIRPLETLDDCRRVAALERSVWGDADDIVPATVLIVSIKRGGILLGAFDRAGVLQGFVYSMPAVKDGRLTQWSHMLGVAPAARGSGLGLRLKLAQREHAAAMGIELIEWTFDPLQALNAHLNFARLGVTVSEYVEDLYGESPSPLHAGTPTDRVVAEWHLAAPHVERRIHAGSSPTLRDSSLLTAVLVNPSRQEGDCLEPGMADLHSTATRVLVEIPTDFTAMLTARPDLALAWRQATRDIFQSYLPRSYRILDFHLARSAGRGHYLLVKN